MKKALPKAQKGLAKLARVVKTANKTSGNTLKGAKPIVRKATRIADAQKSLSASALSGMTASQLRSKLSALMKEASAASTSKASTKKLAFKQKGGVSGKALPKAQNGQLIQKPHKYIKRGGGYRPGLLNDMDPKVIKAKKELAKRKAGLKTTDYTAGFKKSAAKIKSKMQKGGPIGKLTHNVKTYLRKVKDTNSMTPPGTAKTKKDLKKATRQRGRTVTSPSGLTQRVNRKGVVKKNQGGGRPMSAKRAIRKMTRKRG